MTTKIGKLSYVKGDVTTPQIDNGVALICHVCNDLGLFGAGVAAGIAKKFPKVKTNYTSYIDSSYKLEKNSKGSGNPLGMVDFCDERDTGNTQIWVANMIAQHGVIPQEKKPIRYASLVKCMEKVAKKVHTANDVMGLNVEIHAPKFGSDLAKGNWIFITELIEEIWINCGINVVIYEFD
jgi:O-acetyl-ADP-ribose deacetylase (regulator of RNase III)